MNGSRVFCHGELEYVPTSEVRRAKNGARFHKPKKGSPHWLLTGKPVDPTRIPNPIAPSGKGSFGKRKPYRQRKSKTPSPIVIVTKRALPDKRVRRQRKSEIPISMVLVTKRVLPDKRARKQRKSETPRPIVSMTKRVLPDKKLRRQRKIVGGK